MGSLSQPLRVADGLRCPCVGRCRGGSGADGGMYEEVAEYNMPFVEVQCVLSSFMVMSWELFVVAVTTVEGL